MNQPHVLDSPPERPDACCLLIVDDDRPHVLLLERIVAMAGASSTHTVTDSRTAIAHCLDVCPDLILIDLDMPHSNAPATLRSIRQCLPEVGFFPVIAITRDTSQGARRRAFDAGANDFLTKPCDHVELVQRVANLLTMRALYQAVHRDNVEVRARYNSNW